MLEQPGRPRDFKPRQPRRLWRRRVKLQIAPIMAAKPPPTRLSCCGSAADEARLAADLTWISSQVIAAIAPDHLRALVLEGAYARGEGVPVPNFTLEDDGYALVVVVAATDPELRAIIQVRLDKIIHRARDQQQIGLQLRMMRWECLNQTSPSLLNSELRWTHRVLIGDPNVFKRMPLLPLWRAPQGEIIHRLVSQGQRLLVNQQRLLAVGTPTDSEREQMFDSLMRVLVECGAVRLAALGMYHPSLEIRKERLEALEERHHAKFMALYRVAHRYALRPDMRLFEEAHPLDWQARVIWLWLDSLRRFETARLGRACPDWEHYCSAFVDKAQRDGGGVLHHLIANARHFGVLEWLRRPLWSLRHPRARLISSLPLLLSDHHGLPAPALRHALALPARSSWSQAVERFHALQNELNETYEPKPI